MWRVLLLVLIVGVVVFSLGRNRGPGSVSAPAPSIAGFHVVYRIEVHAQGTEVTRREVDVRRPFDSRDLTYAENGTDPVSGFVSAGTRLYGLNGASVLDYGDRVAASPPRRLPLPADPARPRPAAPGQEDGERPGGRAQL